MNATLGVAGLILTVFLSLRLALSQAGWYYDQAASRGSSAQNLRLLQRKGDFAGIAAERARSGKVSGRTFGWVMRLQMQGSPAIIWKELLVQPRTMKALMVFMLLVNLVLAIGCGFAPISPRAPEAGGYILTFTEGFWCLMVTTFMGQGGFQEMLRKVDLIKALPIPPFAVVRNEIVARSLFVIFGSCLASLVFAVISPLQWQIALSSAAFWSATAILFTSCIFFVAILFPDLEDQSQRQFRALVMMLALVVTGGLPIAIFALILAFHAWPIFAALAGSVFAAAIAAVLFFISGNLYASYNPSE